MSRNYLHIAYWKIPISLAAVAAFASASCRPEAPPGLLKKGSGLYISAASDLMPDADPGPETANYGGTMIPVTIKTAKAGQDFTIQMWSNGVMLDSEKYQIQPSSFNLVNAAGEDYVQPIPLLKFPMNVGDSWKWSGQMVTGPVARKADAVVTTSDDKVDMGSPADALLVEVDLSMYSGASEPATRRLSFWFVKGKGLVKRDFAGSTSRAPTSGTKQ